MVLDEGERVYTCKKRRCKSHQCHFCVSGDARPVAPDTDASEGEEEDGEGGEVADDVRGVAFDGVPKEKAHETDVERLRRERLEVKAAAKQRIINARTNGLSVLVKASEIALGAKDGKEPILEQTVSCTYGGVLAPYVNDAGDGIKCYSAADTNAADPSGRRWGFRRFQEVYPLEGVVPAGYAGRNIFVLLWIGVAVKKGKLAGHAMFFVAPWEHMTKKANKVKPFCLVLRAEDFQSVERWVNPAKAENTHLHAFTRKSWSTKMVAMLPEFQPERAAPDTMEPPETLDVDLASSVESAATPAQPNVSLVQYLSDSFLLHRLTHVFLCPGPTISCSASAESGCPGTPHSPFR